MLILAAMGCREPGEIRPAEGPLALRGGRPRNVLMVSIDTLRRDALGRYGGSVPTPNLDAFLADAVAFDDHATCANWTFPGVSCALLGRTVVEAGTVPRYLRTHREPFPDGTPFLAGWLAEAGLHTVLVSSNEWLGPEQGTSQGYAEVELVEGDAPAVWGRAVDRLEAALDADPDRPWFLHVHWLDPHAPYDPGDAWVAGLDTLPEIPWDLSSFGEHYRAVGEWEALTGDERDALLAHLRARYDGEIARLDAWFGAWWADVRARGWDRDALVVLWSDHGEQLFEHGHATHAYQLYGEENDGIAAVWARGLVPWAWDGPTRAEDLAPTVLDALGLAAPDEVTGVAVGRADPDRTRSAFTLGRLGPQQALRQGDDVLLFDWTTGRLEQYDRGADPGQLRDVMDPTSERTRALWSLLRPEVEAASALVPEYPVTWPEGI